MKGHMTLLAQICAFVLLLSMVTVYGLGGKSGSGNLRSADKRPRMEVLHEEARIFMFHNFLTDEECDHLISLAKPKLSRSGVVGDEEGHSKISDIRTSNGMFLQRDHDHVVSEIERRIARWTLLPAENGEGLQILRYDPSQKYDGHFDYFFDKAGIQNGGNRYATVLMYLSDVEEGGETVFPNIPAPDGDNGPEFSDCARHHLAAKPKKGNAVLFHSIKPSGELERRSLHTACPVIKGQKWSAPKWIHVGKYARPGMDMPVAVEQHPQKVLGPNGCGNNHEKCADWAATGECQKNANFMVGTKLKPGNCLLACDRCDILANAGGKKSYTS
jgi:prolyl 4-hydroxylase